MLQRSIKRIRTVGVTADCFVRVGEHEPAVTIQIVSAQTLLQQDDRGDVPVFVLGSNCLFSDIRDGWKAHCGSRLAN